MITVQTLVTAMIMCAHRNLDSEFSAALWSFYVNYTVRTAAPHNNPAER